MTAGYLVDVGVISPQCMPADEYAAACEAVQLPALAHGYGIAHLVLADGRRFTQVTPLGVTAGGSRTVVDWLPIGGHVPKHRQRW